MTDAELLGYIKRRYIVKPRLGKIFWKRPPRNYPNLLGKEAGTLCFSDKWYRTVKVLGRQIKSAKIIFLYSKGRLPRPCIDHKNGLSLDDRIGNLREASRKQNAQNKLYGRANRMLPMGVRLTSSGKFSARIIQNGQYFHLGTYETVTEAEAIYRAKRKELFGEFA